MVGIPGNFLTLWVFLQQGIRDRVNLLLFSLAIADLTHVLCHFFMKVECYVRPFDPLTADNWRVQLTPNVVYYAFCANYVSGMLIVVMAVDRCLSVTLPLRVNRIMTFRHMLIAITLTYAVVLACYIPTFIQYTVRWRLDPATNRSMAFLIPNPDYPLDPEISRLITTVLTLGVQPASVVVVVVCSVVTVVKLRQATRMRMAMSRGEGGQSGGRGAGKGKGSSSTINQTESKITQMLVFLCLVYVVCILPIVIGSLVNHFVPQFFVYQRYHNTFTVVYVMISTMSCLNASVNFFAYLALSSRFRATLRDTVPCCAVFLSKAGCFRREAAYNAKRNDDSASCATSGHTTDSIVS